MHTLVLGGIRSGKSEWAEQLAEQLAGDDGVVLYAATAPDRPEDADWTARITAHQKRRPGHWDTVEVGAEPGQLPAALRAAAAGSVVLVDDVGGWLTGALDAASAWELADPMAAVAAVVEEFVAALGATAARAVLVSPEVGWTVVPATRSGRIFVDAQGTLNQRLAAVCESTVLVAAGQPVRLGGVARAEPMPAAAVDHGAALRSAAASAVDVSPVTPALVDQERPEELTVTAPDWAGGEASVARLAGWGGAPGVLAELAQWVGSVRGAAPFTRIRCVVFAADHGVEAGSGAAQARELLAGEGLLPLLAHRAGVTIRLVDTGLTGESLPDTLSADRVRAGSAPLDQRDALTATEVDAALDLGARVADEEVDGGADLLIPVILTRSAIVPATVVIAALCEVEPIRALGFDAYLPDSEWIRRCVAIRDGVHRVHQAAATLATRRLLATAGGTDLAAAAGFLARAAARKTPALIDGVGAAAAGLLARALAPEAPAWWNAPHGSGRAGEREAFSALKLTPVTELGVQLAEGAGALLALPLVTAAADLAAAAPVTAPAPVDEADEPQTFLGDWPAGSSGSPEDGNPPETGDASGGNETAASGA